MRESYECGHVKLDQRNKVKDISKRIDVIYLHAVHGFRVNKIEVATGLKYTSALNILENYNNTGSIRPFLQKW